MRIAEAPASSGESNWTDVQIKGEAKLLRGEQGVTLRHPVRRIVRVFSYSDRGELIDYQEGVDWIFDRGQLARTHGSRIPDFARYRYSSAQGCQNGVLTRQCARSALKRLARLGRGTTTDPDGFEFGTEPRNPPLTITFNLYVDYDAVIDAPMVAAAQHPLRNAQHIVCAGDSIAAGAHTVDDYYFQKGNQSWCGLLAHYFKGTKTFENVAVPGSAIDGFDLEAILAKRPQTDAVIIAFGMNDHVEGAGNLTRFETKLEAAVKLLRSRNIEVLIVGFFQQNPLWVDERPDDTIAYNRAMAAISQRNQVAFVDMYEVFEHFSGPHKAYYELTADFMHHPNIYGQKIYFSALLPYFLSENVDARRVENYVIADQ